MGANGAVRTVLRNADKPLSTNEIADRTGFTWHPVKDALTSLYEQGEIDRRKLSDRHILWSETPINL